MFQYRVGLLSCKWSVAFFSGVLFNAPMFATGEPVQIEYVFDCPEFQQLREQYPIERVAGKGGDFERALRLCRWLAPRLKHESNYDNHIPCNSLACLELRRAFAERLPVSAVLNRQNPANIREPQKRNASVNWYYAKNSYYFFFDSVSTFGVPKESDVLYVVPEGFDVRRQRLKWLEFWKAKYNDMDMEERIAKTKEQTFHITSAVLWDDPI